MEFTEIIQQFGVGLGGSVVVCIVLYRILVERIKLLERIISRHDKRETVHTGLINRLLIMIDKTNELKKTLDDYRDELKKIDEEYKIAKKIDQ